LTSDFHENNLLLAGAAGTMTDETLSHYRIQERLA
jgi:hypothetical protein